MIKLEPGYLYGTMAITCTRNPWGRTYFLPEPDELVRKDLEPKVWVPSQGEMQLATTPAKPSKLLRALVEKL